mmetsp:Transcript_20035/g.33257  ORF Transcript_20035/g.33257 Transcript_20035/m.33257 type:complete len:292 (+) Transcript_20035:392-1267(+)
MGMIACERLSESTLLRAHVLSRIGLLQDHHHQGISTAVRGPLPKLRHKHLYHREPMLVTNTDVDSQVGCRTHPLLIEELTPSETQLRLIDLDIILATITTILQLVQATRIDERTLLAWIFYQPSLTSPKNSFRWLLAGRVQQVNHIGTTSTTQTRSENAEWIHPSLSLVLLQTNIHPTAIQTPTDTAHLLQVVTGECTTIARLPRIHFILQERLTIMVATIIHHNAAHPTLFSTLRSRILDRIRKVTHTNQYFLGNPISGLSDSTLTRGFFRERRCLTGEVAEPQPECKPL